MTGIEMIAAERKRRVTVEGYTTAGHDEFHDKGELLEAAACYIGAALCCERGYDEGATISHVAITSVAFPWDRELWKPSMNPIDNLLKAGALVAAEIDRLKAREGTDGQG